jgi:hypothetical protein
MLTGLRRHVRGLRGKNKVGSADIIKGEVRTGDIHTGAVTPDKLASVPASKIACPTGTVRTVGLCMEVARRVSSDNMFVDQNTCGQAGRRMTTLAELRPALAEGKIDPVAPPSHSGGAADWTFDPYGTVVQTYAIDSGDAVSELDAQTPIIGELHFRCVTGP